MDEGGERTSVGRSSGSFGGGKEELGGRERSYCCPQLLTSILESQAEAADGCCNPILDLQLMAGRQVTELQKANLTSVFCIKLEHQKILSVAQDSSLKFIWRKEK